MSDIPEGWKITYWMKPIPDRNHDYEFAHDDYDGTNGLCGTAPTRDSCIEQIKEIEEEAMLMADEIPGLEGTRDQLNDISLIRG